MRSLCAFSSATSQPEIRIDRMPAFVFGSTNLPPHWKHRWLAAATYTGEQRRTRLESRMQAAQRLLALVAAILVGM